MSGSAMLPPRPSPAPWHTLEQMQTPAAAAPSKLTARVSTLGALLSSVPGGRGYRNHIRVSTLPVTVESIYDTFGRTEYAHRLECSPELHAVLQRLPAARVPRSVSLYR